MKSAIPIVCVASVMFGYICVPTVRAGADNADARMAARPEIRVRVENEPLKKVIEELATSAGVAAEYDFPHLYDATVTADMKGNPLALVRTLGEGYNFAVQVGDQKWLIGRPLVVRLYPVKYLTGAKAAEAEEQISRLIALEMDTPATPAVRYLPEQKAFEISARPKGHGFAASYLQAVDVKPLHVSYDVRVYEAKKLPEVSGIIGADEARTLFANIEAMPECRRRSAHAEAECRTEVTLHPKADGQNSEPASVSLYANALDAGRNVVLQTHSKINARHSEVFESGTTVHVESGHTVISYLVHSENGGVLLAITPTVVQ